MSLTIRLSETFTDESLPLLTRDALINPGSMYLYDFLDPWCNPHADGPLDGTAVFRDLIDNGATASITSGGFSSLAGPSGIASSGVPGALHLGASGAYDLAPLNAEFVIIFWIKTPASGFAETPYQRLFTMGSETAGNAAQWYVDTGGDGRTYRFQYGLGSMVANQQIAGQNAGVARQYAFHVRPASGLLAVYVDGTVQTQVAPGAFTLQSANGLQPHINGGWIGTIYRIYQENLSLSGRSAREQIVADYTMNAARFM